MPSRSALEGHRAGCSFLPVCSRLLEEEVGRAETAVGLVRDVVLRLSREEEPAAVRALGPATANILSSSSSSSSVSKAKRERDTAEAREAAMEERDGVVCSLKGGSKESTAASMKPVSRKAPRKRKMLRTEKEG